MAIQNVILAGADISVSGVSAGLILGAGQSAALDVSFAPQPGDVLQGSITIVSNASNSQLTIGLAGNGGTIAANGNNVSGPSNGAHSVSLNWIPNGSNAVGYNTYSSTTSGGPYVLLTNAPVTGTGYTDSTVQSGQRYFYVVTSVAANKTESVYSNEAVATIP